MASFAFATICLAVVLAVSLRIHQLPQSPHVSN
jgi:hypothetical protein